MGRKKTTIILPYPSRTSSLPLLKQTSPRPSSPSSTHPRSTSFLLPRSRLLLDLVTAFIWTLLVTPLSSTKEKALKLTISSSLEKPSFKRECFSATNQSRQLAHHLPPIDILSVSTLPLKLRLLKRPPETLQEEEWRTTRWVEVGSEDQILSLEIRSQRRFELVSLSYSSVTRRVPDEAPTCLSLPLSAGTTVINPFAHQWLLENYVPSPQTTIQRTSMYASYVSVCEASEIKVSFVLFSFQSRRLEIHRLTPVPLL